MYLNLKLIKNQRPEDHRRKWNVDDDEDDDLERNKSSKRDHDDDSSDEDLDKEPKPKRELLKARDYKVYKYDLTIIKKTSKSKKVLKSN